MLRHRILQINRTRDQPQSKTGRKKIVIKKLSANDQLDNGPVIFITAT